MSQNIVIDNGTQFCRAGFAGDDAPRSVFPSIIGTPKVNIPLLGSRIRDHYVGEEALSKRGVLKINRCLETGSITDWDAMERVWSHALLNELSVAPNECSVLLSDHIFSHKEEREKSAQIFFESFKTPALSIQYQSVLSLYGAGRTSGIVFDSGFDTSYSVPIIEGTPVEKAIMQLYLGGNQLTEFLVQLLSAKGISLTTSAEKTLVQDIKEKLCFVTQDYDDEMRRFRDFKNNNSNNNNNNDNNSSGNDTSSNGSSSSNGNIESTYELPNGDIIAIDTERFDCPECILHPNKLGYAFYGAPEYLYNSIRRCENLSTQELMYSNVVLSGGNTLFPGFSKRLHKELVNLAPRTTTVNVVALPERNHLAWIGGSILASGTALMNFWVTKLEYDEFGPSSILRK